MYSDNRELLLMELAESQKQAILESLDRINTSTAFRTKPVIVKLLTYLVTEYIAGRSDHIKGYTIGLDVFGLGKDFDPNSNPLVRNNAVRLRALLRAYNSGEGQGDPVRIEIPKGRYVPRITRSNIGTTTSAGTPETEPVAVADLAPAAIAVLPFRYLSRDEDLEYLTYGFSQQLSNALTRYEDLRVIGVSGRFEGVDVNSELQKEGIDFVVEGDVRTVGKKLQISCRLASTSDNTQLWGESFRIDMEQEDLFEFEDTVTAKVASLIGSEFGVIHRERYQRTLDFRARSLDEQTALLKWYHFVSVPLAQQATLEFRDYLMKAREATPESALLNALVASVHNTIWLNEFPCADEPFSTFVEAAEKAYALDPDNEIVLSNLGAKCFATDERERFVRLFDRVLGHKPISPLRSGGWAFWACLFGEWERGKLLLDQVLDHNIDVPPWLYIVESLYHYNNHHYEKALDEAHNFQNPASLWGPLLRVIALSQLDRTEEADVEFQALLALRPEFVETGRRILERFIKDRGLREQVLEGFEKIGVKLA